MPKRRHSEEESEDSDYLRRKMKKYEKKLERRHRNKSHRNRGDSSSPPPVILSPLPSEHEDENEMEIRSEVYVMENSLNAGTSNAATPPAAADNLQFDFPDMPVNEEPVKEIPELEEDILNLLGATPSRDKNYGPDIRSELAVRWAHVATNGLSKDDKKDLLDSHLVPKNCTLIDAPKLNPEVKAALSDALIKKDKALEYKQTQLAASISCTSEALSRLFTMEHKDQKVIKLLIDAGRLMCDSQYKESVTRRSFICSTIKREIKDHLYTTEIDSFLFGEKLAETLKSAKAISKSGAEIKIPPKKYAPNQPRQTGQFLNQRPPLPAARHPGARRRYEPTPPASTARPPLRPLPQPQYQQPPRRPPPRWQPPQAPRR